MISKYYTHFRMMFGRKTVQCKNKHLIAGYHHDKQLSQCKRRQYSALLYISIIQVIGPSLHKRRKVLILSQWNRTTLQWARSWREWRYIVPFHLQQWKIIFINQYRLMVSVSYNKRLQKNDYGRCRACFIRNIIFQTKHLEEKKNLQWQNK